MAFDGRFGKVVIEKGVVLEFREFELLGPKVESSLENAEGFLLIEHADGKEVTDLQDEAVRLLQQCGLGNADVPGKSDDLLLRGKMRMQIRKSLLWILGQIGERASQLVRSSQSLVQNHVIDGQRKQRVGLAAKISDAVLNRGVYDGIVVELVRNCFIVPLEQVLVDAVIFIEQLQRRFQALSQAINRSVVKTLIVHTTDFEDDAHFACLGEKDVRTNESVQIDLLAERAGFVVVLEDSTKPEHDHPFALEWG